MVTEGDFFFFQVCRVPGRDIAGSKILGGFTVQPLTVAPARKRENLELGLRLGLGFTCSHSLWLHSQGTAWQLREFKLLLLLPERWQYQSNFKTLLHDNCVLH